METTGIRQGMRAFGVSQWYKWYTNIVQGFTNGTIGFPNCTIGSIGKITNGTKMVKITNGTNGRTPNGAYNAFGCDGHLLHSGDA